MFLKGFFSKKSDAQKIFSGFGGVKTVFSPKVGWVTCLGCVNVDKDTYPTQVGNDFEIKVSENNYFEVLNMCFEDSDYMSGTISGRKVEFITIIGDGYKFALIVDKRFKDAMYRHLGKNCVEIQCDSKTCSINEKYCEFLLSLG